MVAAEVGGIPEALGIDAGILIPCGDPQTLGKALISPLVDAELKRSIGSAAREKRPRAYAAELVMEQISGRYAELGFVAPGSVRGEREKEKCVE